MGEVSDAGIFRYKQKYHTFVVRMYGGQCEFVGMSPSLHIEDIARAAIDVAIRSGAEVKDNRDIPLEIDYVSNAKQHTAKVTVMVKHEFHVELVRHEEVCT